MDPVLVAVVVYVEVQPIPGESVGAVIRRAIEQAKRSNDSPTYIVATVEGDRKQELGLRNTFTALIKRLSVRIGKYDHQEGPDKIW